MEPRPDGEGTAAEHVQTLKLRVVRATAEQLRLPQVPQRPVRVRRGGVRARRPELLTALNDTTRRGTKRRRGGFRKNAFRKKRTRPGLGPAAAETRRIRDFERRRSRGGHGEYRTDASAAHPRGGTPADGAQSLELGAYGGVTSEVEQLKRDRLLLLKEVMRLREEQSATADEVRRLGARLQSTEQFQTTMLNFVDQVRESGGKLENLSFDGFAALDIPGLSTGTVPGAAPRKRRQMYLPPSADPPPPRADLARAFNGVGELGFAGPSSAQRLPGAGSLGSLCSARPRMRWRIGSRRSRRTCRRRMTLAHQMLARFRPTPPIQLPDHEGWLDAFAANEHANDGGSRPLAHGEAEAQHAMDDGVAPPSPPARRARGGTSPTRSCRPSSSAGLVWRSSSRSGSWIP